MANKITNSLLALIFIIIIETPKSINAKYFKIHIQGYMPLI